MINPEKWLIVYSTVTGNTKQIAEAIYEGFGEEKADICSILELVNEEKFSIEDYKNIAVGYWLTRGAPDKSVQELLAKLEYKTVILFQTQGAELGSEHSITAFARAGSHLNPNCKILGTFASQGKINPALLARRKNGDATNPHSANERNKTRWASAALHPNEDDFNRAKEFVVAMERKLNLIKKYAEKIK